MHTGHVQHATTHSGAGRPGQAGGTRQPLGVGALARGPGVVGAEAEALLAFAAWGPWSAHPARHAWYTHLPTPALLVYSTREAGQTPSQRTVQEEVLAFNAVAVHMHGTDQLKRPAERRGV